MQDFRRNLQVGSWLFRYDIGSAWRTGDGGDLAKEVTWVEYLERSLAALLIPTSYDTPIDDKVISIADRSKVKKGVDSYAAQLRREHLEVDQGIWFGSWATGISKPGSDVNLRLVLSLSDRPPQERIFKYLPIGFPVGVDLCVYTRDEFKFLGKNSPGMSQAIHPGISV